MVEVDESGIRPGLARITAIPAIYRPSLALAVSTTRMWRAFLAAQPAASKIAAISPRRTMDSRAFIRAAAVAAAVLTMTVATPAAAAPAANAAPSCVNVQHGRTFYEETAFGKYYDHWVKITNNCASKKKLKVDWRGAFMPDSKCTTINKGKSAEFTKSGKWDAYAGWYGC
ncbi:hypothetical protein [Nonomuraea sp. NPDC049750]|uniref:hypothetical protein n=2 Tax=unclassified Nonomuraea TaxID=2593643 RepID=UPI003403F077